MKSKKPLVKENPYRTELEKFILREVVVKDSFGDTFEGVCKALNNPHLNIVLMTEDEKIIIKNPMVIRRKRGE